MKSEYRIRLHPPFIVGNEAKYASEAIAQGDLALGEYIGRFERLVADYMEVEYAVAVSSGTAALHLSLLALDVMPSTRIAIPALTFIAPVNAALYCQANVLLTDSDRDTWLMIPQAPPLGFNLPVALYGSIFSTFPEDDQLVDLSQAMGMKLHGRRFPASRIATLSFNGNKTITTGSGGMVLTRDKGLADEVRFLANQAKLPGPDFVHPRIGYNYRMGNVAAAIGCAQMEGIQEILNRQSYIDWTYRGAFRLDERLQFHGYPSECEPSRWLFTMLILEGREKRDAVIRALAEKRIESRPVFRPIHEYRPSLKTIGPLPNATRIADCGISLPSGAGLTEEEQDKVCDIVLRELGQQPPAKAGG